MKACSICSIEKPVEAFKKHKGKTEKFCKDCHNAAMRRLRDDEQYRARRAAYLRNTREKEASRARERRHADSYRKRYPEKAVAHRTLRTAIANGSICKPDTCQSCGEPPEQRRDGVSQLHAHHDDYDKPLDVQWLCHSCHSRHHRARRNGQ